MRGFTLLELQVAVLLGVVVAALSGLLLTLAFQRQIETAARAEIRHEIARLDGTLQWALFGAEQVLLGPERVAIRGRGVLLELGPSGLLVDGQSRAREAVTVSLEGAREEAGLLALDLAMVHRGETTVVRLHYPLEARVAVLR